MVPLALPANLTSMHLPRALMVPSVPIVHACGGESLHGHIYSWLQLRVNPEGTSTHRPPGPEIGPTGTIGGPGRRKVSDGVGLGAGWLGFAVVVHDGRIDAA